MRKEAATRQPTIRRENTSITNADVDEAAPGRDVGEIRHPQLIGSRRDKLAIDEIGRPVRPRPSACAAAHPRAAAHGTGQPHGAHQPPHRAPGNTIALAQRFRCAA